MVTSAVFLKIFRIAMTLVVLVLGTAYVYAHRAELAVLREVSLPELAALSLSLFAFFLTTGYTFFLLARMLSLHLRAEEWIGLTFMTNAFNYLGPIRPGAVVKAVYLKRRGMAYSRFSSLLVANGLLMLLCSGIAGLIVLALARWIRGVTSPGLAAVCGALIVVSLCPFLLPLAPFRRDGRIWNLLNQAVQGMKEIRSQRRWMAGVGATMLLQYVVAATCCMISFRALGFEMDFLTALTIGVFVSISNQITMTPNNVGVQEVVMAYLYSTSGMDFSEGVLGSGLIRAVHIVLSFALTPVFTWKMGRRTHETVSADR